MVGEIRILSIIYFSKFKYISSGLGRDLLAGIGNGDCFQGRQQKE